MLGFKIKVVGMKDLKKMLKAPFREAMAKTLNSIAEQIGQEQGKISQSSFKTFGAYSRRSLFVWKSKSNRPVMEQNTGVGSFSPYLRRLETGFQPKPITISAQSGPIFQATGRPIPSKLSRKSDGTLKAKYSLKRLKNIVILNVRSENVIFVREGKKLKRVRIMKKKTARVNAYKWHIQAVNKVYKPGLVNKLFLKHFV